jgi:hypothetical protein
MKKLFKGSALVYTLIMMMFLLVSALALATTTLIQQRGSLALGDSVKAFQLANDGFEDITAVYKHDPTISTIGGIATCTNGSGTSPAVVKKDITTGHYEATFVKTSSAGGGVATLCTTPISEVAEVKIVATVGSSTRAIQTAFAGTNVGLYETSCTRSEQSGGNTTMWCVQIDTKTGKGEKAYVSTTGAPVFATFTKPFSAETGGEIGQYSISCGGTYTSSYQALTCARTNTKTGDIKCLNLLTLREIDPSPIFPYTESIP